MTTWRTAVHDFIEVTPLRWLLHTHHSWLAWGWALLTALAVGIGGGWLIAEFGVLPIIGLTLAAGYALWVLRNMEMAYWGVIALITLLPFGSLPFEIGFTPTFLDLALLALFFVWLAPLTLSEEKPEFVFTPLDGPILAFALLAVSSFVAGLSHTPLTSYLIRHFAEILMSIAVFYVVTNTLTDRGRLRRLTRFFLWCASAAAGLGLVLYVMPEDLSMHLLSALGRFGYPTGPGVLRYIRDDPTLMQRATSTSIDPNVLGSLLNIAIAVAVPQLFIRRPVIKRFVLIPMLGVMSLCLGLTISRGSMVGLAAAVAGLGVLRYRKILPVLVIVGLLILILPWTQEYVTHFIEGIQGEDLSTQMRFGEYKDSLILIGRHPFLGVGFGGTPDIDTYLGVSMLYLIMAEQMGLIGLGIFLIILVILFVRFWRQRQAAENRSKIEALFYGYHAGLVGGLVSGVFDRYFFSLEFHHSVTLFWLILALATVTTEMVKRPAEGTPGAHADSLPTA